MAHGHPDFGQAQATKIVHPTADLGEIAARLGSPNKYHRGGNVIFQSSFENGLDNVGFSSGLGGASYRLIGTPTFEGGVACELVKMGIDILVRPIELTRIGFEIAFQPISGVNMLEMDIDYDDGDDLWSHEIFVYLTADLIQLDDSAGVNQDIATYAFNDPYVNLWNIMKLVVDIEEGCYHKLYFNHKEYDISAYSPEAGVSSGDERFTCTFFSWPTGGGDGQTVIDNIIITINEP